MAPWNRREVAVVARGRGAVRAAQPAARRAARRPTAPSPASPPTEEAGAAKPRPKADKKADKTATRNRRPSRRPTSQSRQERQPSQETEARQDAAPPSPPRATPLPAPLRPPRPPAAATRGELPPRRRAAGRPLRQPRRAAASRSTVDHLGRRHRAVKRALEHVRNRKRTEANEIKNVDLRSGGEEAGRMGDPAQRRRRRRFCALHGLHQRQPELAEHRHAAPQGRGHRCSRTGTTPPPSARFFANNKPLSAKGKLALARALLAQGDRKGAEALVREAWRNDALLAGGRSCRCWSSSANS